MNAQGQETDTAIPRQWLDSVLRRLEALPHVRAVTEITTAPVVLADGSLLQHPGYADGVLYLPPMGYQGMMVPDAPTADDLHRARQQLDYLLAEYPFKTADMRANYLALLMAPMIRRLLNHPLPIGIITAPSKGSGKTFLADALRTLYGGVIYPGFPNSEELGKKITTALLAPGAVVIFDNVKSMVAGEALEMTLTTAVWRDRVLGTQRTVEVVNRHQWLITSNNATISEDIARRSIVVEIDPGIEKPYLREGFAISDWPGYVREHREEILVALLTLVRHGLRDGSPSAPGRADSFGGFVALSRHILSSCGIAGDVMSKASSEGVAATDADTWLEYLHALHGMGEAGLIDVERFTMIELLRAAQNNGGMHPSARRMVDLIAEYGGSKSSPSARIFGVFTSKWANYVADGMVLRKKIGHAKTLVWRLEGAPSHPGGGL